MSTTAVVRILAGNVARSPFIAVPDDEGVVDVDDVTVRLEPPAGYTLDGVDDDGNLDLTADIVEDDPNEFHVDFVVPDDAPNDWWLFRWESRSPSPTISHENRFRSTASGINNP